MQHTLSIYKFQVLMYLTILCLCLPLAIPALFLSFKLIKKKFLGTLFNKGAAVILACTGKYTSQ